MPQDSFRSAVYRSFVTCDDPKGVVECKTVRKSKSGSQKMEDKFKYQRIQPKSNTSSEREREDKDSRGSSEDLHNLSSFQVMEVSKEAQKLNEVIDSLSNRASFDKQSKYIANDLLKGALDLQESLVMLGNLQESSRYVAKSKKKQKEKLVGEPRFMDFNRFEEYDQETDFQKPRTSVASSRDCYEELRDVITESFARQKLLPNGIAGGKDLVRNYNLDYCVDAPSSSSSQTSLIQSYSSNSSPSKVRNEKSKGPNLIAKLMGLDEVTSSKPANSISYEQNKNKMLARHLIDLDLPRPRKPPFQVQTLAGKRRTLEEMIQTMQFQGLVGKKPVDRYDDDDDGDHSDGSYSTTSLTVENTPIVIMRPRHVSENQTRVFQANYYFDEERPTKSREVPKKPRKELQLVVRGSVRPREVHEKLSERRSIKQTLHKEGKTSGVSTARPVKKATVVQDNSSVVKTKHSKPPRPRVQKKETIVKVIDNVEKVALSTRKESDVKASKSRESIKTQNQNETTSLKLSKPGRGSNISKRQIARERTTATDKHMILTTSQKSSTSKKNSIEEKAGSKPFAALVENIPSDDNLPIDLPIGETAMKGTISEQIPEEVDLSYNPTYETSGNEASCSGESSEPTIEDSKYTEYDSSVTFSDPDKMKGLINTTDTRSLLLSSASFRSRVEELFDTWTSDKYETALPTARSPDCEAIFSFVLLECAKEMLERKSRSCTKMVLSLPSYASSKPKCHLSLDQLVQEILDGIEYLRSYSKCNGGIIVVDNIFPVLERDLWGKTEVTGAWDLGWENGFSAEEVDEVVNGIQMLVLSDLVDDVVEDFTYW